MNRLLNLHQAQLQCYEDLQKLETHVFVEFLPENFTKLERFITFEYYFPVIEDDIAVEFKQKRYKIIREAKRTWLNLYVNAYEIRFQEYEQQYQTELHRFQFMSSGYSSINSGTIMTLYSAFNNYINHRTNRMKQEISYETIPIYRRQLLRQHQLLGTRKKMVSICPNVIVDLIYHPFTSTELAYLSRGNI